MIEMIDDITYCPDCTDEMVPSDVSEAESGVTRTMTMTCDCGYSTPCGQVFYPGRGFEIVVEAAPDDSCWDCGMDAAYRTQRVNDGGYATCSGHTSPMLASLLTGDY